MSAAGRQMGLSPAVVSKRISQLEKRLGVRLIQRTTRQLTLTETGKGFYERILGVLDGIEEAEAFVSQRADKPRGTLAVTAPTAFGRKHIVPHLRTFQENYPEVQLQIDLCDRLVDVVGEGYDLAIRVGALSDSSLVAKRLAPSRRVLCAAPAYLKEMGRPETLTDLAKHRCLAFMEQEHWDLLGPEGEVHYRVQSVIRTNSTEVVREAALAGLGIAFRSIWDVAEDLKAGRLEIVLPQYRETPNVGVYALYPGREFIPAKLEVFLDFLEELYGPTPYWDQGIKIPAPTASGRRAKPKAKEKKVA